MNTRLLNLSEAASIALHAMCYISALSEKVSSKQIAEEIGASPHHLSKVLRRLVVADCLTAEKGPSGGFYMTQAQRQKTFMDVFEAIEGKFHSGHCSRNQGPCNRGLCIFGGLLCEVDEKVESYFRNTPMNGSAGWPSLMKEACRKPLSDKKLSKTA